MRTLNTIETGALIQTLSELGPALFGDGEYNVNIKQENNKLIIEIAERDYQGQFEEYLKTLDDEIFTAACEYYTNVTGQDLSKINKITPEIIKKFKEVVKIVVRRKIQSLSEKYGC